MEEQMQIHDDGMEKYLTFVVDEQSYGLKIEHVIEIIGTQAATVVPRLPYYIKGIINLRGKIIPIMDLASRFGKGETTYTDRTCIVVMEYEQHVVGLIVQEIDEVIDWKADDISTPPVQQHGRNEFISGIIRQEDKVTLLLSCEEVLN